MSSSRKPRLGLVGDSIAQHYAPYLAPLLSPAFSQAFSIEDGAYARAAEDWDRPVGANGGDSGRALAFVRDVVPHGMFDVLLVNAGLHDVRRTAHGLQVPPWSHRDNVRAIVASCVSHQVLPVWVTTTPVYDDRHNAVAVGFRRFNRDVLRYNVIAMECVTAAEVPSIDLYAFSAPFGAKAVDDHVHFVPEVRAAQAEYIVEELRSLTW